jgi:hypothetical protein
VRTIVFQSFRTQNVAVWQSKCLASGRAWAAARGYEYRFFDDAFFDLCPAWYREKTQGSKLLMSDLARLIAARTLLDDGFERAIWLDADLLVFKPEKFDVETKSDFAFCRELWVNRDASGRFVGWMRVNNCVCTFDRGNAFLDFYIDACQRIVRDSPAKPSQLGVGTMFLSSLHKIMPLELIGSVGTFNPILMDHLSRGNLEPLRAYRQKLDQPIAAANLCGSMPGLNIQGVLMSEAIYEGSVAQLLGATGAEVSQ